MIATPRLVLDYCRQGYRPIPFEQRSKKSAVSDWVQLRVSEQDVVRYWSDGQGVGLVLGPSGLLDIDIDDDVAARLAPCFLPPTGMIGGHDNRPATHWFYRGSVAAAGTSAAGGRVSAALTPAVGIGDSDCGSGGHAVVAAVAADTQGVADTRLDNSTSFVASSYV
ncbi:MAG: bifunctional DNA primase/polymerase [Gemmataceae bacterium]|nr:bifunctional DNA primase/polymerase [Gemmataceae bacterium]